MPVTPDQPRSHAGTAIVLGERYRDKITGFTGVATAHAIHVTGFPRTELSPRYAEGEVYSFDARWFDDVRLDHVKPECVNGKRPKPGETCEQHYERLQAERAVSLSNPSLVVGEGK